jgi:hypothetical protein
MPMHNGKWISANELIRLDEAGTYQDWHKNKMGTEAERQRWKQSVAFLSGGDTSHLDEQESS